LFIVIVPGTGFRHPRKQLHIRILLSGS